MDITLAKYMADENGTNFNVKIVVNSEELLVPMDLDNSHYTEIMKQVDAGELTIEPADE